MNFETLEHQLELPFGGKTDWCPRCNPVVLLDGGQPEIFRSICDRHFREMEAAFDTEAFLKSLDDALEQGRREADAARQHSPMMPGRFR